MIRLRECTTGSLHVLLIFYSFIFELPDNLHSGMRVASAVVVKGAGEGVKDKNGKDVIRPYTPITAPEVTGHVDFLVKKYAEGAMTNHIHSLKPGDKLAIKGPIDKYQVSRSMYHYVSLLIPHSTKQMSLNR